MGGWPGGSAELKFELELSFAIVFSGPFAFFFGGGVWRPANLFDKIQLFSRMSRVIEIYNLYASERATMVPWA